MEIGLIISEETKRALIKYQAKHHTSTPLKLPRDTGKGVKVNCQIEGIEEISRLMRQGPSKSRGVDD